MTACVTCHHSRKLLAVAASLWISLALVPTTARSQSTADEASVEKRLSKIEAGQQQIQNRLERLESKLDQLAESASGFSHVVVRIQTGDGKPLPGYGATLQTDSKQSREAKATGTSDEKGVAIDRYMPYGQYRLSLHEPTGWSVSMRELVVEVGQPLELDVAAPNPADRGELVLQSGLRTEAFMELPFGEIRTFQGMAYTVGYSAEPNAERSRHTRFPQLGSGIDRVGARVKVAVTRNISQPDGGNLEWHWSLASTPAGQTGDLFFTPEGVATLDVVDAESAVPVEDANFFSGVDGKEKVGYLILSETEDLEDSHSIPVPAGDVQVAVAGVLGEATPDVRKALDIETQAGRSIWLNVNLRDDSQWIGRIFDEAGWKRIGGFNILSQTVSIEPAEKQTVVLASP